jgi:hypothetical protein
MAGDAAIMAKHVAQEDIPYTIKSGDFRLLLTPSFGVEWNDNVNASETDPQHDIILRPTLGLKAYYPLPEQAALNLDVDVGYDQYLDHTSYSGVRVLTGSVLAFDFYVKDFRFDIHDRFSFTQDAAGVSALYGTAKFPNLQNLAGLTVDWDLNDVILTVGYDHLNYFIFSDQYDYLDHTSELGMARAGFRVHPRVTVGVEGTASSTAYDKPILNNYLNYSGGVYADWNPGTAISIQPRFGYTLYDSQQTSLFLLAQNQTAWYADLTVRHAITKSISYSFSAGHELKPGIQADFIEDWYVRPSVTWSFLRDFSFTTSLSYEHGKQSAQGFTVAASEVYDWFTGDFELSHPIFKIRSGSLNYRFTLRDSDRANRGYTQNLVGLKLTYVTP